LSTERAQRASVLNRLPACRGLICYFLLTFSFSWLMFLPGLLTYYGVLNLSSQAVRWFAIAGLLAPTLSGFIMTGVIEGWQGVSRLLRRIVRWRVGLGWYLFAFIALPAVMVLATIVRPGALESLDVSGQPFRVAYLQAFISMAVVGGPLFEEPGWTGFAQLRLQRLYGSLVGGLVLGSLWALWHLPGFLIPSQDLSDIPPRGTVFDFAVFAFALVGLRLIIIWVVNNTSDSVLMAILVHASWNTFYATSLIRLFPTPAVLGSYSNLTIGACALALVLIAATRGRLGCQNEADTPPKEAAVPPG
jgi:uncharacterized protein